MFCKVRQYRAENSNINIKKENTDLGHLTEGRPLEMWITQQTDCIIQDSPEKQNQ